MSGFFGETNIGGSMPGGASANNSRRKSSAERHVGRNIFYALGAISVPAVLYLGGSAAEAIKDMNPFKDVQDGLSGNLNPTPQSAVQPGITLDLGANTASVHGGGSDVKS